MSQAKKLKRMILVIDDNQEFINDFTFFTREIFTIISAHKGQDGLTLLRTQDPDIILLDMRLSDEESGLDVLKKIKRIDPDIPVLIITQFPDVPSAVEAMRLGATFYTSKAPSIEALVTLIEQKIRDLPWRRLLREEQRQKFGHLIGEGQVMQDVRKKIAQCARVEVPVLITGESGTGKELVAHAIHDQSARASFAMFSVNCSNLEPHLFESEFFGHEKGAFTGAYKTQKGKFECAHEGTLFLDEIADLPLLSQPKLLKAIEYGTFQRLGGEEVLQANVRLIAATNRELKPLVSDKAFREDLYYRLDVLQVHIPPLRERREDIPELIRHYLELACAEIKKPVPNIPAAVMNTWQNDDWPGNVRELKHRMMQVALDTADDTVSLRQINNKTNESALKDFYNGLFCLPYKEAKQSLMNRFQSDYVHKAMQKYDGNVGKIAEELEMDRTTIYRILKG